MFEDLVAQAYGQENFHQVVWKGNNIEDEASRRSQPKPILSNLSESRDEIPFKGGSL